MNQKKQTSPNDWERGPFDDPVRQATDRAQSIVALTVGAVALAIHNGPLMIGCGVVGLLIGILGLTFGNW